MMSGCFPTGAGMHALWSPDAFASVSDYDSWAAELEEDKDIRRQVRKGVLVPINIHSDLVAQIEVRVGAAGGSALSSREKRYRVVSSEPYRFVSNGRIAVGGLEHVCGNVSKPARSMTLPAGVWSVNIHLLAWLDEPGGKTKRGKPSANALPDYLVILSASSRKGRFRTSLQTFPRPAGAD
jgi:hypothetical protein